jgi:hypothetical protein
VAAPLGYDGAFCSPDNGMGAAPRTGPTVLLQSGDYSMAGGGSGA